MKKSVCLLLFLCFSTVSLAQLSGDVVKDNRKLLTDYKYVIEGHVTGKVTIKIAVNAEGEISSKKVLDNETTISSTPAKIKAVNHVGKFKFEPGTWFPKFHQGKIVITMVKPK